MISLRAYLPLILFKIIDESDKGTSSFGDGATLINLNSVFKQFWNKKNPS